MTNLTNAEPGRSLELVDGRGEREAISRALRRAARQARQPPSLIVGGAGGLRARRGDRLFRWGIISSFAAIVVAPLIVAAVYLWGMASDQYELESKLVLRTSTSSPLNSLGGLSGLVSSQKAQDTQIVADYIKSSAMVNSLQSSFDFYRLFGRADTDFLSRLKEGATIEDKVRYWRQHVDVKVDAASGIITLDVRAFSPEDTIGVSKAVVAQAETLGNSLSDRSRHDSLAQADTELHRAEEALRLATAAMRVERNRLGVIDADAAAKEISKILVALRLQLSEVEGSLAVQDAAGARSPQRASLEARSAALHRQINEFTAAIAGNTNSSEGNLADRMSQLSPFQLNMELAAGEYAKATMSYQASRSDAEMQQVYLVPFAQPTEVQKSTYPRRWLEWAIVAGSCMLAWSICAVVAFQIRDHMAK